MLTFVLLLVVLALMVAGVVHVASRGFRDGYRYDDCHADVTLGWSAGPDPDRAHALVEVTNPAGSPVVVTVAIRPISALSLIVHEQVSARAPRHLREAPVDGPMMVVDGFRTRREQFEFLAGPTTDVVEVQVAAHQRRGRVRVLEFRQSMPPRQEAWGLADAS